VLILLIIHNIVILTKEGSPQETPQRVYNCDFSANDK
jgi:hypothetical protein